MSWPIRFLEAPPLHPLDAESRYYGGSVDFSKMAIGDMCFYHHQGKPCTDPMQLAHLSLTAHYFAVNAKRPPLILALPDAATAPNGTLYFLVDGQCYSHTCTKCGKRAYKNACNPCTPKGHYDGWTVSGESPNITVAPSVDYDDPGGDGGPPRKHYHGFIQNGVIGNG